MAVVVAVVFFVFIVVETQEDCLADPLLWLHALLRRIHLLYGAKHSPPGQGARRTECCSGTHPPVCAPGPPLIQDFYGSRSYFESFSIWISIIFDADYDGINPVAGR